MRIEDLTETELSILKMVAGNMTTAEIAFALDVDEFDAFSLMIGINQKFGTSDIKVAADLAIGYGFIDIEL